MAPIDRGDEAYERGDYQAALDEYRVALKWDPEDAYVHYSMAFAYHELGQSQEALESIEAALALQPGDPVFNEAMVDLLLAQDNAPAARRHVEDASRAGLIEDVLREALERWIEEHEELDAEEEAAQQV